MKVLVVVFLSVIAQAVGNTCLSKGMKYIGSVFDVESGFSPLVLVHAMTSPMIWAGTLLLIVFFALFAVALSWADLSFVQPATAIGYILNVALAHAFLNEPISMSRWMGTLLIGAGVILVSKSAVSQPAATEAAAGGGSGRDHKGGFGK